MPKCSRQGLHLKSARIAKLAKQKVNSVELSSLDSEGDFEGCESYCFDDHLVDEEVINAALSLEVDRRSFKEKGVLHWVQCSNSLAKS